MASFVIEEFVGNGVLNTLVPKLVEEGWDDIPTLKLMNSEDMNALNFTTQQKEALELRSYLHDRALLQYGDKLEESRKSLPEILSMSSLSLSSEFGMKKGHIARFTDTTSPCVVSIPQSLPSRRINTSRSLSENNRESELSSDSKKTESLARSSSRKSMSLSLSSDFGMKKGHINARFTDTTSLSVVSIPQSFPSGRINTSRSLSENNHENELLLDSKKTESLSRSRKGMTYNQMPEKSFSNNDTKERDVYNGLVASEPVWKLFCCLKPHNDDNILASYSDIENISVQKLTPEYKIGMEHLVKTMTPPMKASELWRNKPAILLCIRRPGCIMCRAEAHQLYARKPIFDTLGIQLIAVLHDQLESEVRDFWPRYWGGIVVLDRELNFFKALGGGKLLKEKFIKGFVFNPRAIANYKRAKAMGIDQNFKGEGETKGGMFVVGSGKSGIAYQFIEKNFGDWAPINEVIEICSQL